MPFGAQLECLSMHGTSALSYSHRPADISSNISWKPYDATYFETAVCEKCLNGAAAKVERSQVVLRLLFASVDSFEAMPSLFKSPF